MYVQGGTVSTAQESKSGRINLRIEPARRARLERAAALKHLSLSEFLLSSAAEAAENALLDQVVFEVDAVERLKLEKYLQAPARNSSKLEDLLSRKPAWS